MKEPMELSASSRSLLDAAREGLGPDAATIARMRGKIGAAVATGAATGGAAGATIATKLGILGLVVAVGVGAVVFATRGDDAEPARIASEPSEAPVAQTQIATREAPAPAVAPETESPTIEMPAIARTAPTAPTAPTPAPKAAPAKADKPARPRTIDLKREVELVDRAMVALRAGDLAAALAAVRLHAAETGGAGQLAEDAAAIEVDVLCKKKDATAQQRLAAFDARWPRSAQRAKLCR
jgi:hypothetical protein